MLGAGKRQLNAVIRFSGGGSGLTLTRLVAAVSTALPAGSLGYFMSTSSGGSLQLENEEHTLSKLVGQLSPPPPNTPKPEDNAKLSSTDTTTLATADPVPALPREDLSRFTLANYTELIEKHSVPQQSLKTLLRLVRKAHRQGLPAPNNISAEQMLQLYGIASLRARLRYLEYLSFKQPKAERMKDRKSAAANTLLPPPERSTTTDKTGAYRLFHNAIMIRLRLSTMHQFFEQRLVANMPFAPKIALDFGYDHLMSARESTKTVKDFHSLYSFNRTRREPFNLILFSVGGDPEFEREMPGHNKDMLASATVCRTLIEGRTAMFPCTVTSQRITDLIPREKVVYLSPDGEEVIDSLKDDETYVIGMLVDKETLDGASAKRARQLGVRSARLPAKIRLQWEQNEKALHFDQVIKVLYHVYRGGDWQKSIARINRKLVVDADGPDDD